MSTVTVYPLATGTGIAAEWTTEAGTDIQAIGLKGAGLMFGARRPGDKWNMVTLADPHRFGEWKTRKAMRAWVDVFIGDAMKED